MNKRMLLIICFSILFLFGCMPEDDSITCKIICKLDDDYVLAADSDDELIITDGDDEEEITFCLRPADDECYYIEHEETGLVLGTEDESEEVHAGVTLVEYEEDDTQLWMIAEAEDDYYYIINKETGLFLDICGAQIFDGNTLQIYTRNDAFNAQSFLFADVEDDDVEYEPVTIDLEDYEENYESVQGSQSTIAPLEITAETISLEDIMTLGENCRIICLLDDAYAIGAETEADDSVIKVVLTSSEEEDVYEYYFSEYDEDTYMIIHTESGLAITLQDGATANHTSLCLERGTGDESQLWRIAPAPTEGYYYIISVSSGRYLDVTGLSVRDGNWLQVYQPGVSDAQSWRFELGE